jgi:hypothetical protein
VHFVRRLSVELRSLLREAGVQYILDGIQLLDLSGFIHFAHNAEPWLPLLRYDSTHNTDVETVCGRSLRGPIFRPLLGAPAVPLKFNWVPNAMVPNAISVLSSRVRTRKLAGVSREYDWAELVSMTLLVG